MGPDAVTLLDAPPHGRAATLFVSVFSRCRQFTTSGDAVRHLLAGGELKIPGSFDREEIKVFAMPDVRIGGFGPLFSVVCLLAAAAAIGGGRRNLAIAVAVALPLLASVVAFPYPWSARYVPQLWLVPLAVLPLALGDHRRGVRALGLCAMTAAGANILLIGVGHLYGTVPHSQMLRGRIADLAAQGTELELDLGRYRSNRARLAELGVRFREVEDPHFDLSTFLGTPKAEVLKLEASQRNGSRTFHLTLAVPPTATHHEVSVVSDDDHRVASTFRIDGPRGEIPLSHSGPIVLEIAVCNSVGCGPPLRLEPAQPAP
jgi:hypothetical protein